MSLNFQFLCLKCSLNVYFTNEYGDLLISHNAFHHFYYFPGTFGHKWSFALINSRQEYINILEGYKNYDGLIPDTWINGSTNTTTRVITYDDYIPDNSGSFS